MPSLANTGIAICTASIHDQASLLSESTMRSIDALIDRILSGCGSIWYNSI